MSLQLPTYTAEPALQAQDPKYLNACHSYEPGTSVQSVEIIRGGVSSIYRHIRVKLNNYRLDKKKG